VADVAKVDDVKHGVRTGARFVVIVGVVLLGTHLTPVAAAPPGPPSRDSKLDSLRAQMAEASAAEASLLGRIDASDARRRGLDGRVATLDRQVAAVQGDLDLAQQRLDALQAHVAGIEGRLAEARRRLGAASDELRRRALAAYMGRSDIGRYAELVLRVRDMRQLAASSSYLNAVLQAQADALHRASTLHKEIGRLRDDAEAARLASQRGRDAIAGRKVALDQSRQEADGLRAQARAELADQGRALDEIQTRRNEFEAQIAALQVTSDGLAVLLRDRQAGETAVAAGRGVLAPPVNGPITSGFGPRVHPIFGNVRMHTGIDFGASVGTPIRAAADGVVVIAGPYGGYGNATVIDHGNALATLYGHQSALLVATGDRVNRGQVIGLVGCTGYCTGPHLHFEVRLYGTPVDPLHYL
jgi:murein DD-endopeptidase MepM/ murein hydrolase activator NlpD